MAVKSGNKQRQNNRKSLSLEKMAQKIYEESRENEKVQNYFNERGINRESIDRFQLGISEFDGCDRFVIPVRDITGCVAYLKLRITPDDESAEEIAKAMGKRTSIGKSVIYPTDAKRVLIGEDDLTRSTSSDVLICRDELERIVAMQEGIQMPVVSGDGLVQTFRNEWIDELKKARNIYLCLGEDAYYTYIITSELSDDDILNYYIENGYEETLKYISDYYSSLVNAENDLLISYGNYLLEKADVVAEIINEANQAGCLEGDHYNQGCISDTLIISDRTAERFLNIEDNDNYSNIMIRQKDDLTSGTFYISKILSGKEGENEEN